MAARQEAWSITNTKRRKQMELPAWIEEGSPQNTFTQRERHYITIAPERDQNKSVPIVLVALFLSIALLLVVVYVSVYSGSSEAVIPLISIPDPIVFSDPGIFQKPNRFVLKDTTIFLVQTPTGDPINPRNDHWISEMKNVAYIKPKTLIQELVAYYRSNPNFLWYVVTREDTFVFIGNLEDEFRTLSPTQTHYFGALRATLQCGKDERADEREVADLDNLDWTRYIDGSFIALSQAAMRRLTEASTKCATLYSCPNEELQLGKCMRSVGVSAIANPDFYYMSPWKDDLPTGNKMGDSNNPYGVPISFGHCTKEEMAFLSTLQSKDLVPYSRIPDSLNT